MRVRFGCWDLQYQSSTYPYGGLVISNFDILTPGVRLERRGLILWYGNGTQIGALPSTVYRIVYNIIISAVLLISTVSPYDTAYEYGNHMHILYVRKQLQ